MIVGYIRVSITEQNSVRQEEALKNHGVERIFMEKISCKNMNRSRLNELFCEGRRHSDCRILFPSCQIDQGASLHPRQDLEEKSDLSVTEVEHLHNNLVWPSDAHHLCQSLFV